MSRLSIEVTPEQHQRLGHRALHGQTLGLHPRALAGIRDEGGHIPAHTNRRERAGIPWKRSLLPSGMTPTGRHASYGLTPAAAGDLRSARRMGYPAATATPGYLKHAANRSANERPSLVPSRSAIRTCESCTADITTSSSPVPGKAGRWSRCDETFPTISPAADQPARPGREGRGALFVAPPRPGARGRAGGNARARLAAPLREGGETRKGRLPVADCRPTIAGRGQPSRRSSARGPRMPPHRGRRHSTAVETLLTFCPPARTPARTSTRARSPGRRCRRARSMPWVPASRPANRFRSVTMIAPPARVNAPRRDRLRGSAPECRIAAL